MPDLQPRKQIPAGPIGASIALIIAATIAVEGGYVNDPKDPGGETNMGVTKRVAVEHGYVGPMRTLPREVATSIYYQSYMVKPGYDLLVPLDAAVAEELYDTNVNMGSVRPSSWFQLSINELCGTKLVVDGKVGQGTIAAFAGCQKRIGSTTMCVVMLDKLDARQKAEYDRLVRVNPNLQKFYRGWVNNRIGNVDRRKCSQGRT